MRTIFMDRSVRKARPPAFSLFDEAVHLIRQRWESRDGFATAIAETLKALGSSAMNTRPKITSNSAL